MNEHNKYLHGRFWITAQLIVDIVNAVLSIPIAVLFAAQWDMATYFRMWRLEKACEQLEGES